jgi:hypothetical protein
MLGGRDPDNVLRIFDALAGFDFTYANWKAIVELHYSIDGGDEFDYAFRSDYFQFTRPPHE